MPDCSLHPLPTPEALRAFFRDATAEAAAAANFPPRLCEAAILDRVGAAAVQTLSILTVGSGHRGTLVEEISASDFLPDYSAFVAAEKFRDRRRWAPVPPLAAGWVAYYVHVLIVGAERLERQGSHFAAGLAARVPRNSTEPLFIRREGDELVPLRSSDLAANLKRWHLLRNDGRRLAAGVLDRGGLGITAEGAINGRDDGSLAGPYAGSSLLVPDSILGAAASLLDGELTRLGMPPLPKRRLERAPQTVAAGPALPLLSEDRRRPLAYGATEECPIRRGDGFRIGAYEHALRRFERWHSADRLVALALALVFGAGLIHREELLAVMAALVQRRAYHHAGKVFVQTTTSQLGLREAVLEGSVLWFLDGLPPELPADFVARLDLAAATLLAEAGGGDLDRLLDAAAAAATYLLPGPLREFAVGRLVSRSLAFQARARWAVYDGKVLMPRPWTPARRAGIRRGESLASSLREELRPLVAAVREANLARGDEAKRREVKDRLAQIRDEALSSHARLFHRVFVRVAGYEDKPGTHLRYAAPLRAFLETHRARYGDLADDDLPQHWFEIFERDRARHAKSSDSNRAIRQTVSRLLCAELGIPVRHAHGSPPLPAIAIDFMNDADLARALDQVTVLGDVPALIRDRARHYLDLRASSSTRSDEARKIRSEDFCGDHQGMWFAVNYRSGTSTKSGNAGRTRALELKEPELARRLQRLTQGPLFPPEYAGSIEAIAVAAQRRATGNARLDAMAMRRVGINRDYFAALSPGAVSQCSAYERVTRLAHLSRSYGHAGPHVTLRSYYARLGDNRSQWYAELKPRFRLKLTAALMGVAWNIGDEAARQRLRVPRPAPTPPFPALVDCAPWLDSAAVVIDAVAEPDGLRYVACRLAGLSRRDAETCVCIDPAEAGRAEAVLGQLAWSAGKATVPPLLSKAALASGLRLLNEMLRRFDLPLAHDALARIAVGPKGLELRKIRPATATVHALVEAAIAAEVQPRADFTQPHRRGRHPREGEAIVRALGDRALKHHEVHIFATVSGRRNDCQALMLSAAFVSALSAFTSTTTSR